MERSPSGWCRRISPIAVTTTGTKSPAKARRRKRDATPPAAGSARQMLIVDGQIHLWEKGTPSLPHRQEPYSAEQAIAAMDQAGVDRALIHPVLWDPDSNELAIEAVRKYPNRFAIMGWFYLDDPNGRDLVANWQERPGMLGLRFYFNERHKRE